MIRLIAKDETKYWNIEKPEGCKLLGIYMYEDSVATYCCEITASREIHFLGTIPTVGYEDEDANEKFLNNIMEGDTHTEEISYIHAHSIDSKKFVPSPFTESDVEDEDDKSAALLKMTREDWCSNQSCYEMDLCNTVE